jgi:hypothetical protein
VHQHQSDERQQRDLECTVARREEQERGGGDQAENFGKASDDREAGVVNGLHGEIDVFGQSEFSWQFERVRQ